MSTEAADQTPLSDRELREALNNATRAAVDPAVPNVDHELHAAMVDMTREHRGDLRPLHALVDHNASKIGLARMDAAAAAVAAGTVDGDVTFDLRDMRPVPWNLDDPYPAFVAHVLLHRSRIQGDPVAMSQTCARIVTARGIDTVAPWNAVSAAALIHPDGVVAGAAAAVEIYRSEELMTWRVMYSRVAAGHHDDPLLASAIVFIATAMAARCNTVEQAELLVRVCNDLDSLLEDVTPASRDLRAAADQCIAASTS